MSRVDTPSCAEASAPRHDGPGSQEAGHVSELDRRVFEDLLMADGGGAQQGHSDNRDGDGESAEVLTATAAQEITPFALLGMRSGLVTQPAQAGPPATLTRDLSEAVQRLLVSDSNHGARQVHVQLKEAVLPGVLVMVAEQQGGIVLDFRSVHAGSRRRLEAWSRRLTEELGRTLGRHVSISIQGVGEADLSGAGP